MLGILSPEKLAVYKSRQSKWSRNSKLTGEIGTTVILKKIEGLEQKTSLHWKMLTEGD
jgi:hypothetical protein